jgi:hypothetical protein
MDQAMLNRSTGNLAAVQESRHSGHERGRADAITSARHWPGRGLTDDIMNPNLSFQTPRIWARTCCSEIVAGFVKDARRKGGKCGAERDALGPAVMGRACFGWNHSHRLPVAFHSLTALRNLYYKMFDPFRNPLPWRPLAVIPGFATAATLLGSGTATLTAILPGSARWRVHRQSLPPPTRGIGLCLESINLANEWATTAGIVGRSVSALHPWR